MIPPCKPNYNDTPLACMTTLMGYGRSTNVLCRKRSEQKYNQTGNTIPLTQVDKEHLEHTTVKYIGTPHLRLGLGQARGAKGVQIAPNSPGPLRLRIPIPHPKTGFEEKV